MRKAHCPQCDHPLRHTQAIANALCPNCGTQLKPKADTWLIEFFLIVILTMTIQFTYNFSVFLVIVHFGLSPFLNRWLGFSSQPKPLIPMDRPKASMDVPPPSRPEPNYEYMLAFLWEIVVVFFLGFSVLMTLPIDQNLRDLLFPLVTLVMWWMFLYTLYKTYRYRFIQRLLEDARHQWGTLIALFLSSVLIYAFLDIFMYLTYKTYYRSIASILAGGIALSLFIQVFILNRIHQKSTSD